MNRFMDYRDCLPTRYPIDLEMLLLINGLRVKVATVLPLMRSKDCAIQGNEEWAPSSLNLRLVLITH